MTEVEVRRSGSALLKLASVGVSPTDFRLSVASPLGVLTIECTVIKSVHPEVLTTVGPVRFD